MDGIGLRIDAKTQVIETTFSLTAVATKLLEPNARRVAVILSPSTVGYWLSVTNQVAAGTAIFVPANTAPFRLYVWEVGDLVRGPLWIFAPAGNPAIGVWQILVDG